MYINIEFYFYTSNIIVDNKDICVIFILEITEVEKMSGYLDIIFLVFLVLIIFGKLKSVLGTGAEDTKVIMLNKEQFEKMYKEIKDAQTAEKSAVDLNSLSPLDRDLAKIPNFNKTGFINGAQKAFEMILSAFSKGDSATLSTLVNKELLKINPDTNQTYLEDIREELSEMRYAQEVLAEFGEEELGVYQKQFIQLAIDEGKRIGHKYITKWPADERAEYLKKTQGQNIRLLGIDWDKYANATNMVCVEYDRFHQDENGHVEPCFKVLFREEIARSEFTYTNAMNRVIELNREYKFDWIAVDRGYGETQLELFHKYGEQHPESGLADKVVGYQFSQKIEVTDPYTRKKDEKHMKPFMVNNSVNLFEKGKMILDPADKYVISELEEYRVQSISAAGLPTYSSENEHALDAMNLALLIFAQKYDSLLKKVYSTKIAFIENVLDKRDFGIESRKINEKPVNEEVEIVPIRVITRHNGTEGIVVATPSRRGNNRGFYPSEFNRSW